MERPTELKNQLKPEVSAVLWGAKSSEGGLGFSHRSREPAQPDGCNAQRHLQANFSAGSTYAASALNSPP